MLVTDHARSAARFDPGSKSRKGTIEALFQVIDLAVEGCKGRDFCGLNGSGDISETTR